MVLIQIIETIIIGIILKYLEIKSWKWWVFGIILCIITNQVYLINS